MVMGFACSFRAASGESRTPIHFACGLVLPGPVSVAGVNRVFDAEGRCTDENVEKQLRGVAHRLIDYVEDNLCPRFALEQMVRDSEGAAASPS